MLIIGRNPVLEMLKFRPLSIEKISILNNLTDKKIKDIINIAKGKNIYIDKLSKDNFEKLFNQKDKSNGISQGIVAKVLDFEYYDFKQILDELSVKDESIIVLLDEIQDPHNLGAIIRTSAAAGAYAIILTEKNTAKINHTVIKTSSGATNFIKIALSSNIYSSIEVLKKSGFEIIGTTLTEGSPLLEHKFQPKTVILFGNEGEGLRKNVLKLCDKKIKIPIYNKKVESLNVSVATGIILYEILRQRS